MGQSKPINTRSILIVEDEALIRFNLVDFFADAGYRVFEAEGADDAIAILDRVSSIRVVLTDVQMPGSMDGLKLANYIRNRFPPTLLVVTSGVLNLSKADLPADSFFVPKPFDPRHVLGQIERFTT
jgi:DNA-binding NtrC family response regulator